RGSSRIVGVAGAQRCVQANSIRPRRAPEPRVPSPEPGVPSPEPRRRARQFHGARHDGRISGKRRLSQIHPRRRSRRETARPARGTGAVRHSPPRLSRRPRAQSHAVRAADDTDQPGDHRRGHPGRCRPGIPVVIEVCLFSSNLYAKGTAIALGLPFFLGIGMAVPWPLAGAGIAALPKPGAWMVRVKQVFGVLILATAIYYGYEAYSIFSNRW